MNPDHDNDDGRECSENNVDCSGVILLAAHIIKVTFIATKLR